MEVLRSVFLRFKFVSHLNVPIFKFVQEKCCNGNISHHAQLHISSEGDAAAVGTSIVNTIIGGCGGGLTCLFAFKFLTLGSYGNGGKWSFLLTLNGVLAGMVSQCAGCDEYTPWTALIVGVFGGLSFISVHVGMLKVGLDDPLDAVAVHGGGGKI